MYHTSLLRGVREIQRQKERGEGEGTINLSEREKEREGVDKKIRQVFCPDAPVSVSFER